MKRTAQWHCRSFRWRAKSTVIGFLSSYNSHMTHLHLKLRELSAKRCGILWCGSNTNHSCCCTRLHLSSVLSPTVSYYCKHWLLVVSCLTSLSVESRVGKADSFSPRQVKEHRYGNVRITLLSHHINPHGVVSYIRRLHPSTMHYSFCHFRVPMVGKSQHAVCLRLQPLFFFTCYDVSLEMESCFVLASWLWMVPKEEIEGCKCQLCQF